MNSVPADNFTRAETDTYFADALSRSTGLAPFYHYRDPMPIDHQTVVRANRDTLYSSAVVDLNVTPARNDGATAYRLEVPAKAPVDGFWSITVYGADGYIAPNDLGVCSLNSLTAAPNAGGSAKIQFRACDARLFAAVSDGAWTPAVVRTG